MSATLSIVIFTRDDAEHLRACLAALQASPPSQPFDVVVFDNASQDHTADVLADFAPRLPLQVIARGGDTSFSQGNNQGWRATDAPFLLFLNPDTVPNGPALDACLELLQARSDVGAVSPRLVYPDGEHQPTGWSLPTLGQLAAEALLRRPREVPPDPSGATSVGWLMGCFVMVPRPLLEELDGWDRAFWFHGTDLELCARIRARDRAVVRLEAHSIVHVGHRGWDRERRRAVQGAQKLWLLRDHGHLASAAYGLLATLRSALRA